MTNEERELLEKAEEIKKRESSKAKARKNKKRKGLFTKALLILMYTYLFYFTERVLDIFASTGQEPVTLIAAVFAALSAESVLSAWIKTTKVKRGE